MALSVSSLVNVRQRCDDIQIFVSTRWVNFTDTRDAEGYARFCFCTCSDQLEQTDPSKDVVLFHFGDVRKKLYEAVTGIAFDFRICTHWYLIVATKVSTSYEYSSGTRCRIPSKSPRKRVRLDKSQLDSSTTNTSP